MIYCVCNKTYWGVCKNTCGPSFAVPSGALCRLAGTSFGCCWLKKTDIKPVDEAWCARNLIVHITFKETAEEHMVDKRQGSANNNINSSATKMCSVFILTWTLRAQVKMILMLDRGLKLSKHCNLQLLHVYKIWLVVYLPLWKLMEWRSVGMMKFRIWWESHSKFHGSQPPTRGY